MAKTPARMKYHPKIREVLKELETRIDAQTGNTTTSQAVLGKIFEDIFYIRVWPWVGTVVKTMEKNWRQRRVGSNYILFYFVTDDGARIYALALRHTSQNPLQPSTLRKYKREIPD